MNSFLKTVTLFLSIGIILPLLFSYIYARDLDKGDFSIPSSPFFQSQGKFLTQTSPLKEVREPSSIQILSPPSTRRLPQEKAPTLVFQFLKVSLPSTSLSKAKRIRPYKKIRNYSDKNLEDTVKTLNI